ncbi:DeoR/GlpR transcriptional regulator [Roseospira marina]|uniref:DeoR/GlpR transcriptional regulator n=2 Tax=Roseospira marina TaxID=140057 RepID=A0A5M6IBL8_9PROT|nr:DeoR/GlpR transcriptional regulator [Roseospira marina]
MLGEQRRRKILDLIQEEGAARVSELSRSFQVSEPTIRQDLEKLEAEGLVLRQRGGAFLKSLPRQVQELALHHLDHMEEKRFMTENRGGADNGTA